MTESTSAEQAWEEWSHRVNPTLDRWGVHSAFLAGYVARRDEVEALRSVVARVEAQTRHLELVSKQVREQGDVQQVIFDDDGVGPALSLADELWVIAFNIRAALAPAETTGANR